MGARRLVALAALAACGGGGERPAPSGPIDLTARPAAADDRVVATVDGRPVYASCVAAQAAGRHLDRQAALADCIHLELLAGAAIARGYDRDPEVIRAGRQAAAARLVDVEVRGKMRRFEDLPAAIRDPMAHERRDSLTARQLRVSWYARVKVAKDERGGPRDQAAERAIRAVHAELGSRADLFKRDLDETLPRAVAAVDATLAYEVGRSDPSPRDWGLQEDFRDALFAIDTPGKLSPPTRTPWGWDLVLYKDYRDLPALTPAELGAQLFPKARLIYWQRWSDALVRQHQVARADDAVLQGLWGAASGARR